ncbi:RES family NAD+ phosphorylase [soil metagenome]
MRFTGTVFRAHDPRWSFRPLSGDGAAIQGGRFNPRGTPALYLGLSVITAVKEASQGLSAKINPLVLCAYEIDCEDILDLRDDATQAEVPTTADVLSCPWLTQTHAGQEPPTWRLARRLIADGVAGVIVPSFAPGAIPDDANIVLWRWTDALPHYCAVHDPSGRLPRNQLSWR